MSGFLLQNQNNPILSLSWENREAHQAACQATVKDMEPMPFQVLAVFLTIRLSDTGAGRSGGGVSSAFVWKTPNWWTNGEDLRLQGSEASKLEATKAKGRRKESSWW